MKPTEETEKQFKELFDKLSVFIYKYGVEEHVDRSVFVSVYLQTLVSYLLMITSEENHEENKKSLLQYLSEVYDEQLKKWKELKDI